MEMEPEMEWTSEKTTYLIDLYRSKPNLWDSKHEYYKNKTKRHESLINMSQRLGVSKAELERKIKNIVGQFSREMKKLKEKSHEGSGSKWFAFKMLLFLKDRNKHYRETLYTTAQQQNSSHEITFIKPEVDSEPEFYEPSEESESYTGFEPEGLTTTIGLPLPMPESVFQNPKPFGTKRRCVEERERAEETYQQIVNNVEEVKAPSPRDECDVYGELIACKLRKLRSDRVRSNVQHVVNSVLWGAELGKYDSYHHTVQSYHPGMSHSPATSAEVND